MPSPNPVIVTVTITEPSGGGPCQITLDKTIASVARGARGSTPPQTPIIWQVGQSSSPGASITGITILADPAGKTPPPGKTFSSWPSTRPQPAKQGSSGNWSVIDTNDNNGTTSIYYGYDITAQVGSNPATTLDPGIDNQPPSP